MKKLFSATAIALALSAGAALAADLPAITAPLPPPPPPPPLWTGFYVGLNAGGTFGGNQSVRTSAAPIFFAPTWNTELAASSSLVTSVIGVGNNSGFVGGAQTGYNVQLGSNWLIGLEADFQGVATNNGSRFFGGVAVPAAFPNERIGSAATLRRKLEYLGTLRGRLGFLVTPDWLVYATGGLAYGGVNLNASVWQNNFPFGPPFGAFANVNDTLVGWTAGAGVEWLFLPNWSAKLEYLYYDLGRSTTSLSPLANISAVGFIRHVSIPYVSSRHDGNLLRLGVNYHFVSPAPAPVVARY